MLFWWPPVSANCLLQKKYHNTPSPSAAPGFSHGKKSGAGVSGMLHMSCSCPAYARHASVSFNSKLLHTHLQRKHMLLPRALSNQMTAKVGSTGKHASRNMSDPQGSSPYRCYRYWHSWRQTTWYDGVEPNVPVLHHAGRHQQLIHYASSTQQIQRATLGSLCCWLSNIFPHSRQLLSPYYVLTARQQLQLSCGYENSSRDGCTSLKANCHHCNGQKSSTNSLTSTPTRTP